MPIWYLPFCMLKDAEQVEYFISYEKVKIVRSVSDRHGIDMKKKK